MAEYLTAGGVMAGSESNDCTVHLVIATLIRNESILVL